MKNLSIIMAAVAIITITACGEVEDKTVEEAPTKEVCLYSHSHENTWLTWTAFKTNDRVPVSGTFKKMEIRGTVSSENPLEVFANAEFLISTKSVDSKDPVRDKKIADHFFGTMEAEHSLSGRVLGISDGKVQASIKMNGIEDTVSFSLKAKDDRIALNGKVLMEKWNAQHNIDSLNAVCYDLHKGADGESKLWQEVELELSTILNKNCK